MKLNYAMAVAGFLLFAIACAWMAERVDALKSIAQTNYTLVVEITNTSTFSIRFEDLKPEVQIRLQAFIMTRGHTNFNKVEIR